MDAWCIEIAAREGLEDPQAGPLAAFLEGAGLPLRGTPRILKGFLLPADLDAAEVDRAARELFADPISEDFVKAPPGGPRGGSCGLWPGYEEASRLVVRRKPGVMDPVAKSAREALADLGILVPRVGTYRAWLLPFAEEGAAAGLRRAGALLANEVIEEILFDRLPEGLPEPGGPPPKARVEIPLLDLDDEGLLELSREGCLSLSLEEMRTIRDWFAGQGREPTLTELETLAQTWSEHCKHKTLTGAIEVEGGRTYENFLKETIKAVTERIAAPWCRSVFVDNAGVVDFDDEDCLCIKVETHNHPSAIEPFGGAGTGVGGVIRDILGTGLGARPLCNLDVFCTAPPDLPAEELPPGTLHPARILDRVTAGVRDYGNPIGIPTVTGAVHFDPDYVGNPLVYCGTVGILPRKAVRKETRPGDVIVVAGGRTGRDGIHGATFSSIELHEESETVSSGAVQIGDPITEKILLDALLEARDRGLYDAITDCGAGGLSSAVGEMGEACGAEVELSGVPLKYEGLSATEIWISEAQERMVFAVPEDRLPEFREVFDAHGVEIAEIGRFTDSGRLRIRFEGEILADLDMDFLHRGLPPVRRKARWVPGRREEAEIPPLDAPGTALLEVLGDWNVCSREWLVRQYDHEVQGMSAAKPFGGPRQRGPGDGAVLAPKPGSKAGFAVATGFNPRYGRIDPASMAEAALDEAVRNVVVRGGDPGRIVVLDNYCWGNTDREEQLGSLVRATEAVCELALAYRTPFVSGKDSLNNEFRVGERTISIPPSLLITAMAPVPDLGKIPDSCLGPAGRPVFCLGFTRRELGGSAYLAVNGLLGASPPRIRDAALQAGLYRALHEAITEGWISAAHDLSEGGLGIAAAEMAFGGERGLFLDLGAVLTDEAESLGDEERLFSESLGRILVEVCPEYEADFVRHFAALDLPASCIGRTLNEALLVVDGVAGDRLMEVPLEDLHEAWSRPLRDGPLACSREAEGGAA